ncbi:MAG: hypothetical protein ACTS3R_20475 [Inquilinaceae bacterium]
MTWHKLGRVFDPADHRLPNGCVEFAQSPQTLVFDDYVRVYFSTRERHEKTGKYLSHVAFADFDKSFKTIRRVSDRPVLPLGGLGSFDEHGIFPINPLRHDGTVMAYTCGWSRRVSVSVETGIGRVVSDDDGETFYRTGLGGPILGASLREPFLVGDPFVRVFGGRFHMWYMFGVRWKHYDGADVPERIYKIGHAVSDDGIRWEKQEGEAIIADRLPDDESQALPTVIEIAGRYHMYFCYRHSFDFRKNQNRGYRIGHAHSDDLLHWTRDDAHMGIDPSPDGWDSEMMCYPHVFACDGKTWMLYNGNAFGRAGFGLAVLE